MQHSMLQRYSFLFRNRQITLLNKVKTAFFASFLHQNVTFTFPFPIFLNQIRTKDYLSGDT